MAPESSLPIEKLRESRILVTGGTGFFGQHLVKVLKSDYGCKYVVVGSRATGDLTDTRSSPLLFRLARDTGRPFDLVFHLAGYNGGIKFNLENPADIYHNNTMMAMNILDECLAFGVTKVVSVVASCAYPHHFSLLAEQDFLDGPPHESVACHGYAKRNLQIASALYRKQYNLMAVCACPTTLYGPGDKFDPENSKVVSSLIAKFVKAKRENSPTVELWGTGTPMREVMYVEDAARLLVETMLYYDVSDIPLNLGSGQELSIYDLATLIATTVGYTGQLIWDCSKPDGQRRKRLELTRMFGYLRHQSYNITPLADGLARTVKWYEENL